MGEKIIVVVDTREQESYSFPTEHFLTQRHALSAGDYSLAGYEHEIAVERKSLDDFVHTIIRERERFRKELEKLALYRHACVVVEASLSELFAHAYSSGAHPNSVFGAALSIIIDHGIPVYFCSNRQIACRFVQEYLLRCFRKESINESDCTGRDNSDTGNS